MRGLLTIFTRDAFSQTIILAAGNGARLASGSHAVSKPLALVGGEPLISRALRHARISGCNDAVIVVGHEAESVREAVHRLRPELAIRFVVVAESAAPNGVSLLAAEQVAAPRFFLQMVDHVFGEIVLPKLIASPFAPGESGRVLVDRAPGADCDLKDATKVRLRGATVVAIGKRVAPWDAIDAGCFALTRAVFGALREVPASEPQTVSSAMRRLVALGALSAVDIAGVTWVDVDTPADLAAAERLASVQWHRTV